MKKMVASQDIMTTSSLQAHTQMLEFVEVVSKSKNENSGGPTDTKPIVHSKRKELIFHNNLPVWFWCQHCGRK
eukprot:m.333645 g.333645  ORF g.333645 m.333645 type:complete len:73 (+) comp17187_c0_seq1:322-540(+)